MCACYVYDFTERFERLPEELIKSLKKLSKKGGFQREIGESTGYDHYQGRISLLKKLRLDEIVKQLPIKGKWSKTSKACSTGEKFWEYVTKEDTRIEGPWKWDSSEPDYIPRQIREVETLYAWQSLVIEKIKQWESRIINVIIDKQGCKGKSILVGKCCCELKIARKIPPLNNYKDLMCLAMSMPTSSAYFIDMPRALDKTKQEEFFSAIESIKDGHIWDNRYYYKEKWIDSPNIWIFSNVPVNTKLLSKDRWKIWKITEDHELEQV